MFDRGPTDGVGRGSDPARGHASAAVVRDAVVEALEGRRPALFLDYDGTLTPIVQRPRDAQLEPGMRQVLGRLARVCTVAVVSGRDRADVELRVDIDALYYAGSHGFDISGPDGMRMEHEGGTEALPDLGAAQRELGDRLASVDGVLVEPKRFAVAVHYRNVPSDQLDRVESAVRQVAESFGNLRVTGGKKVYELRPDIEWDKGRAVLWLLDVLGLDRPDVLPLYIGDDLTDEDAFRALRDRGIGIRVGEPDRSTAARYLLEDTTQVRRFLVELAAVLEGEEPNP